MNTEQKAKAYDEALKRAREWSETKNGYYTPKELCEDIFPELKESDDEKIRKWLISQLKIKSDDTNFDLNIMIDKAISWLEKQGEHKRFRDSIQIGDSVTKNEYDELVNLSQLNRVAKRDADILKKQSEQKPTDEDMKEALRTEYEKGKADAIAEMQKEWNEDDEKRLQSCINILKAKSLMGKVDTANTMWLKSLKQRIGGKL